METTVDFLNKSFSAKVGKSSGGKIRDWDKKKPSGSAEARSTASETLDKAVGWWSRSEQILSKLTNFWASPMQHPPLQSNQGIWALSLEKSRTLELIRFELVEQYQYWGNRRERSLLRRTTNEPLQFSIDGKEGRRMREELVELWCRWKEVKEIWVLGHLFSAEFLFHFSADFFLGVGDWKLARSPLLFLRPLLVSR